MLSSLVISFVLATILFSGYALTMKMFKPVYATKSVDYDVEKVKVANNAPTMYTSVLTADDIVMYYRNGTRYVVKLTDKQGNPLVGQTVVISIIGLNYTRTTDENGIASIGIGLRSGNYTVTAPTGLPSSPMTFTVY